MGYCPLSIRQVHRRGAQARRLARRGVGGLGALERWGAGHAGGRWVLGAQGYTQASADA